MAQSLFHNALGQAPSLPQMQRVLHVRMNGENELNERGMNERMKTRMNWNHHHAYRRGIVVEDPSPPCACHCQHACPKFSSSHCLKAKEKV